MIKDNLILNYDETDVRFPCGLCNTHRRSLDYLKKSESGEETRETHFGFEKLSLYLKSDVKLKRRASDCECLICKVAKSKGFNEALVLKKFDENSENVTKPSRGESVGTFVIKQTY